MPTTEQTSLGFTVANGNARPSRDRKLRYLINEVLSLCPAVRAYHLNQMLHELCPGKWILEADDREFNPIQYAEAGLCRLVDRPIPHSRRVTTWLDAEDVSRTHPRQAWFDVKWGDEAFEMLLVHEYEDGRSIWRYFIMAATKELAEAFFADVCRWRPDLAEAILVFDGDGWERDKRMAEAIRSTTFDSLILRDSLKEDILHDIAWFFDAKQTYDRYGAPWKRGILFVGPPGNGKTHTIKAVLNAAGQRCLYVQSFRTNYGRAEDSIRDVFDEAGKEAPCILVLEDLDTLVTEKNRSYFLNQLDGFMENSGILTLGSSNHPEKLDPAIAKRPSRFDRTYTFDLPEQSERYTYLARWNRAVDPELRLSDETLTDIAVCTEGFTFAYLKELVLSSAVWWASTRGQVPAETIMRTSASTLREQMAGGKKKDKHRSE
jgi:AAA+ superfamily predicted ATPase